MKLVDETIELLSTNGGRASVDQIFTEIYKMKPFGKDGMVSLITEMFHGDERVKINKLGDVELTPFFYTSRSNSSLFSADYTIVDVETTGTKSPLSRITEIGAYKVSNGEIVDEFQTLVNPQAPIPPFIVSLTGITEKMVADAPVFSEIADDWLSFVGFTPIVAHNAQFDLGFINHEISRVFPGHRMVNDHFCTVRISRRLLPGLYNHRLHTIAEHFAIPIVNRHRAAGDALITANVFIRMLAVLERKDVHSFEDLRSYLQRAPYDRYRRYRRYRPYHHTA
ncbi:MAG: 3'-5' exonuclease [Pyrinomonadaceae bacterium]